MREIIESLRETIESTAVDQVIREAKDRGHRMGVWHWQTSQQVQSRCIQCNAGMSVSEGGYLSFGLDQPCLIGLSAKHDLIAFDSAGGPITYE